MAPTRHRFRRVATLGIAIEPVVDRHYAFPKSIRPFVVGRKNWLFCDTVAGANASANLYSLIETAKANGIEPYAYLKMLFTELPKARTVEDVEALLPVAQVSAERAAA